MRGEIMILEVKDTLKKLNASGYEAYIVGGYPRDHYLKRKTDDYDICTSATPSQLKSIFPDIEEVRYGSCIYQVNGVSMEITTFRKELSYKKHRFLEQYEFTTSLKEDLERRDFVMNTLCIDADGNYIDLLGARKDMDASVLRTVGNPMIRLEEDALRILRALRFTALLNLTIDPDLENAIQTQSHLLKELSYDRKRQELDQILSVPHGLELLKKFQLGNVLDLGSLKGVIWVQNILGIWSQMNVDQYPFKKSEKAIMNSLKQLLHVNFMDPIILYQTSDDLLKIVADIKKLNFSLIKERKSNLPIQSREEIDIEWEQLFHCKSQLSSQEKYKIMHEIEKEIVTGRLENKTDFIIDRWNEKISIQEKENRV